MGGGLLYESFPLGSDFTNNLPCKTAQLHPWFDSYWKSLARPILMCHQSMRNQTVRKREKDFLRADRKPNGAAYSSFDSILLWTKLGRCSNTPCRWQKEKWLESIKIHEWFRKHMTKYDCGILTEKNKWTNPEIHWLKLNFTLIYYHDIVALNQMIKKKKWLAYSDLCSLGHRGEKKPKAKQKKCT